MANKIIASMTNLADSGQDKFIENWTEYAKLTLYEQGVSQKFINSPQASYILAKIVTDIVEDGTLSKAAETFIATLRVNHPHSEDLEEASNV
jgi:hypothetical protein